MIGLRCVAGVNFAYFRTDRWSRRGMKVTFRRCALFPCGRMMKLCWLRTTFSRRRPKSRHRPDRSMVSILRHAIVAVSVLKLHWSKFRSPSHGLSLQRNANVLARAHLLDFHPRPPPPTLRSWIRRSMADQPLGIALTIILGAYPSVTLGYLVKRSERKDLPIALCFAIKPPPTTPKSSHTAVAAG